MVVTFLYTPNNTYHLASSSAFAIPIPSPALKAAPSPKTAPALEHGRRTVIDYASPTVARILDAAETLFAENCFAGTRMDDIAARAGVNKATLYYHIGSKEKIYEIVLYRHIKTFADVLEKRLEGRNDPVEALLEIVRHHAEAAIADNRASRTVAHELAGDSLRMTPDILAQYARVYAATVNVMTAGANAGRLRQINPSLAHLLIAGPLFVSTIKRRSQPRPADDAASQELTNPSLEDLVPLLEQLVREFLALPPTS